MWSIYLLFFTFDWTKKPYAHQWLSRRKLSVEWVFYWTRKRMTVDAQSIAHWMDLSHLWLYFVIILDIVYYNYYVLFSMAATAVSATTSLAMELDDSLFQNDEQMTAVGYALSAPTIHCTPNAVTADLTATPVAQHTELCLNEAASESTAFQLVKVPSTEKSTCSACRLRSLLICSDCVANKCKQLKNSLFCLRLRKCKRNRTAIV